MAEVINLNKQRKARARQAAKTQAAENRAAFGQPKPAREQRKQETARAAKDLDGKKIED